MKRLILLVALIACTFAEFPNWNVGGKPKVWYVGGEFTGVFQPESGEYVQSPNIAKWDGNKWSAVHNNGTDGRVTALNFDMCGNAYIGGFFTRVALENTGPVAKINGKTNTIEALPGITWNAGAKVYDIAIDCQNIPKNLETCPCDIYIGGEFTATIIESGKVAKNIVAYLYDSKYTWDNLNADLDGPVHQVYKKDFGVWSESKHYMWAAGGFTDRLARYHTKKKEWRKIPEAKNVINAPIKALYYKGESYFGGQDKIYVGGAFDTETCKSVCYFDYVKEEFKQVGTRNFPIGEVRAIQMNDDEFMIGGDFNNDKESPFKYVAKGKENGGWFHITEDAGSYITAPVNSMVICNGAWYNAIFKQCEAGTGAIGGESKMLQFFYKSQYYTFGNNTDGIVYVVKTNLELSSSNRISYSWIMLIIPLVAWILM